VNRILEQACQALCDTLLAAIPELKAAAPTQEVPDVPAQYPAVAVLPDHFDIETWPEGEVEDADGVPIVLDGHLALMECGSRTGSVRIFVAARNPAERSRIEDKIYRAFLDDDAATGRLLVTLASVEVEERTTGATWPVAFVLDGEDWAEEMAFSEKRWTYLRAFVDVPIFVLRPNAWPVTQATVELQAQPATVPIPTITTPAQAAALDELEQVVTDSDGNVGPVPP
jgi:hypothetical protein